MGYIDAYPSLIDHDSTDPNFETINNTAFLYYTRWHYGDVTTSLNRDMVRIPITMTPP